MAQCLNHTRRKFEQAKEGETAASDEALTLIGAIYRHEQIIRDKSLTGQKSSATGHSIVNRLCATYGNGATNNVID
jgi:hypothetical protein